MISHFVFLQGIGRGILILANLTGRFSLQVLLYVAIKLSLPRHYFLACITREPFTHSFLCIDDGSFVSDLVFNKICLVCKLLYAL